MTLKELKNMTMETKEKLNYKTLFDGKATTYQIVAEKKAEDSELTVLENGYVLYRCDNRVTAFLLKECNSYVYYMAQGDPIKISGEEMDQMEWSVPLLMHGERRIANNRVKYQRRIEVPELTSEKDDDTWRMTEMFENNTESYEKSAEAIVLEQDHFEYLLSGLTATQKEIAYRIYRDGYDWKEIVNEFGGNYSSVRQMNERIKERIRKKILSE